LHSDEPEIHCARLILIWVLLCSVVFDHSTRPHGTILFWILMDDLGAQVQQHPHSYISYHYNENDAKMLFMRWKFANRFTTSSQFSECFSGCTVWSCFCPLLAL